jgi:glycosyltransferase involved in cell wall biosynthesis
MRDSEQLCIWYISKYVSPPAKNSSGGRGYLIMREFARTGHRAVILTSDSNALADPPEFNGPSLIQHVDGMTVLWVRTMKYSIAKSIRRILSWVDFEYRLFRVSKKGLPKPDVLIVSSLSLLTLLNGFWLKRQYGCRLIFEIRDIWPLTIVEEGGFSKWNPMVMFLGFIELLGYKYADEVVGTMPNLKEHVSDVLGGQREVHCIPMGVDESLLISSSALSNDYIHQYFPGDKFVIAHAGAIGITNALDTFLDCAESLKNNPKLCFLIIGDGDLRDYYIKKYGHLPNLIFAPKVSKDKVQAVLSHCDLLYFSVHSSKVWQFGQSLNKIIDYMVSGKPIIASYTGFPSMINEANCGSYVPAGDALSLKDEIERYASMSQAALAEIGLRGKSWILDHRSYQKLAKNYLEILFPHKFMNTISP